MGEIDYGINYGYDSPTETETEREERVNREVAKLKRASSKSRSGQTRKTVRNKNQAMQMAERAIATVDDLESKGFSFPDNFKARIEKNIVELRMRNTGISTKTLNRFKAIYNINRIKSYASITAGGKMIKASQITKSADVKISAVAKIAELKAGIEHVRETISKQEEKTGHSKIAGGKSKTDVKYARILTILERYRQQIDPTLPKASNGIYDEFGRVATGINLTSTNIDMDAVMKLIDKAGDMTANAIVKQVNDSLKNMPGLTAQKEEQYHKEIGWQKDAKMVSKKLDWDRETAYKFVKRVDTSRLWAILSRQYEDSYQVQESFYSTIDQARVLKNNSKIAELNLLLQQDNVTDADIIEKILDLGGE